MTAGGRNAYVDGGRANWRIYLMFLGLVLILFGGIAMIAVSQHVTGGQIHLCTSFPPRPAPAGLRWACGADNTWRLQR